MSLRTKLLAVVLGLNGAFLLLALYWLVTGDAAGGDLTRELRALGDEIVRASSAGERETARARLDALLRDGRVEEVYLVEDAGADLDPRASPTRVVRAADGLSAAGGEEVVEPATRLRVLEQFREARRHGDATTHAVLLSPGAGGHDRPRRGLVATADLAAGRPSGVRAAYLSLLAGFVISSAVSAWLISRWVTRPLARLTAAADRVAAGDFSLDLAPSGSSDEIDRTVGAFHRMSGEIAEYQRNLEDRVLGALDRIRKAEKHLAIAQRLAATGKLASGIAHEINNPLGGMKNAVRALVRGDLSPEKTREYLDLVADGLARVEDTVKKFLTLTPRRVEPRLTDLAEATRRALALAAHRIERKGIRVSTRWGEPAEVTVFGDPSELQQVALNLLLNAADAVPEGRGGRIDVSARRQGEEVLLEVSDDGCGMSPEDQARCFDLFFTTKDVGEGTGLGLAVVHTIVSNHGGRIDVESALGRGTTFRVLLPREGPSEPGVEGAPGPDEPPEEGAREGPREGPPEGAGPVTGAGEPPAGGDASGRAGSAGPRP